MDKIMGIVLISILVAFLSYILVDITSSRINDYNIQEQKNEIIVLQKFVNVHCRDPFVDNSLRLNHLNGLQVYYSNEAICGNLSSGELYCKRVNCELTNSIILSENIPSMELVCGIEYESSKRELVCN